MIELTKLNKKKFFLNCELIEAIESTPDTVITLRNGKIVIVKELPEKIVEMVMAYKRAVFAGFVNASPPAVIEREEEGITE